ncbi:hypothetical protein F4810DRAFT_713659 [Camillea tinctor]|nr:hypothetical protein F4810DRAFT_713659 [Camillea tinctor]
MASERLPVGLGTLKYWVTLSVTHSHGSGDAALVGSARSIAVLSGMWVICMAAPLVIVLRATSPPKRVVVFMLQNVRVEWCAAPESERELRGTDAVDVARCSMPQ